MDRRKHFVLICASSVLLALIYVYAGSTTLDEGQHWSALRYNGDNTLSRHAQLHYQLRMHVSCMSPASRLTTDVQMVVQMRGVCKPSASEAPIW